MAFPFAFCLAEHHHRRSKTTIWQGHHHAFTSLTVSVPG
jgi:hypothetical protein